MKSWHGKIKDHIEQWSSKLGNRGWWPEYVYHFTDVNNAARILSEGYLYSRSECARRDLMVTDNASPKIINETPPQHLDYVRLYFRPKTPTQYNNEGIRPVSKRTLGGAHCPIPIFFGFDAFDILTLDETLFSNGNMASPGVEYGNDIEFFRTIPFNHVFHEGAIFADKRTIVFHRNAEVLVPQKLSLSPALKFIACRTAAEHQTLLHLLPGNLQNLWQTKMRIAHLDLFERRWTYVEEVVVVDNTVMFRFSPNALNSGPFHIRFEYQDMDTGENIQGHRLFDKLIKPGLKVALPNASIGVMRLYLDDALAFAGILVFEDLPF